MSLRQQLEQQVAQLMEEIADASKARDSATVIRLTHHLEDAQSALVQVETAEAALERVSNRNGSSAASGPTAARERLTLRIEDLQPRRSWKPPSRSRNPKAEGEARRRTFVEDVASRGITLTHISGALYRDSSGRVVGIPTATERERNRWWLGLPDAFNVAVLLCELRPGEVAFFVLNEAFLEEHGASLSRDNRGQVKFDVRRRGGGFYLNVPYRGLVGLKRDDASELQ